MDSILLTKLICGGSLGCTAVGAFVYTNSRGSNTLEYLQTQQFEDQRIENLTNGNENLKAQLGSAKLPISVTLQCSDGKKQLESIDWSQKSFTAYCGGRSTLSPDYYSSLGGSDSEDSRE